MSKFSSYFSVFSAAAACVSLCACSSDTSEPSPSEPADAAKVSSLESELGALQGSLQGALESFRVCVDDFKACRAAGSADCIGGLKECLPEPELPADLAAGGDKPGRFGFGGAGTAPVDPAALIACKDDLMAARGQDRAAAGEEFRACLSEAFEDLFADVCDRILVACEGAAATKLCERLTDKCNEPTQSP